MPLADDQGRVGMLIYESSDPDFLDVPHIEMIKILAAQATVAIRNAMLYRDVPLISLIEPLMKKKQVLLNDRRTRWMTFGVLFGVRAASVLFAPADAHYWRRRGGAPAPGDDCRARRWQRHIGLRTRRTARGTAVTCWVR